MLRLRTNTILWAWLAGMAGTAWLGSAAAQAPAADVESAVQVEGPAPFSRAELVHAIGLRLAPGSARPDGRVYLTADGSGHLVLTDERGRQLRLDVSGQTPATATRLAALSVLDLLVAPATPDTLAAPTRDGLNGQGPSPTGGTAKRTSAQAAAAPTPDPDGVAEGPLALRLGLSAALGKGLSALEPWTPGLGVGVYGALGPWRFECLAEGWLAPPSKRRGIDSTMAGLRLRAQVGVQLAAVQVVAGPSLSPFWVWAEAGLSGTLVGLGAALRVPVRVSPALTVLISGGLDWYLRRYAVHAFGHAFLSTPRFGPWLGITASWVMT